MTPDKEELRKEFETTDIKLKALADKYSLNYQTVKSWKSREGWAKVATSAEKVATNSEKLQRKKGAPKGSKNALGNIGGAAPKGNSNAVSHGFFRRIFPNDDETHAIIGEIGIKSPLDIMWENIVIQYTAIARAQKIMFVENKDDLTRVLKRHKENSSLNGESSEKEYELQFAWDKHAAFLQAQSRAISTLEGLISRYEEMLLKDLKNEEQRLRLEKIKLEIGKFKGDEGEQEDDGFIDALKGEARVWDDDNSQEV